METGKVLGREVAAFDEGDSQSVAHDELGSGGGRRCQVVGACLMVHRGIEDYVGLRRKERTRVADNGYKPVSEVFNKRYKDLYFGGVAAFRDADNHIVGLHDSQIAMDGIGSMHEYGGSTRRVEGRNDFRGDIGTLANASHNHTPFCRKNSFHRVHKSIVYMVRQMFDGFFFIFNYLICNIFDLL